MVNSRKPSGGFVSKARATAKARAMVSPDKSRPNRTSQARGP
jgi:hypothetical protein